MAVLYCSDYGFSDRLSQTIARGITKAGVATDMADLMQVDPQELVAIIGRSAGIVLLVRRGVGSVTARSTRPHARTAHAHGKTLRPASATATTVLP